MKKFVCFILLFATMLSGCAVSEGNTAAQTKYAWYENNFDMSVSRTEFEGVYGIDYLNPDIGHDEGFYEKITTNQIFLTIVNGGYLPIPDICVVPEGIVYVVPEALEPIGITTEIIQTEEGRKFLLKYGKDTLLLEKNRMPEKNGKAVEIKFAAIEALDERIYVPLCFVMEQFGGTVNYIDDFTKEFCNESDSDQEKISLIGIEMPTEQEEKFSIAEGLQAVIESSIPEHERLLTLMEERGEDFTEEDPDYDPRAISYSGADFGRYSIYHLEGFEWFPIFFNRYNGEIYGVQPWTPMFTVAKCFPSVRRLY